MTSASRGMLYGIGAYGLWGVFPLYFRLLEPLRRRRGRRSIGCSGRCSSAGSWSRRPAAGTTCGRRWRRRAGRHARGRRRPPSVNWGVYIYAVNPARWSRPRSATTSTRWSPCSSASSCCASGCVRGSGRPSASDRGRRRPHRGIREAADHRADPGPVVRLYGLIKNRVGADVGALTSLTTETIVLAPAAAARSSGWRSTGRGHFTQNPPWQALLLASVGVATVIPLLFFAASARRVPLSTLGLLQYLTPTLQLLCGVLLLGEHMTPARWAGFGLVWVALLVLTVDTLRTASRRRMAARERRNRSRPDRRSRAEAGCRHGSARDAAGRADAGQVGARDPGGRPREPKWDGFRTIVFRDGDEVELGSRNERPMTRYFPEVVEAVRREHAARAACSTARSSSRRGRPARLRGAAAADPPRRSAASRCSPQETPASLVAFDLLALGDENLMDRPFARAPRPARRGAGGRRRRRCT